MLYQTKDFDGSHLEFPISTIINNLHKTNLEEIEDTKVVMRIRKSKKHRQDNDQKKKDKRIKHDIQNIHKTKDRVTRTQLKNQKSISFVVKFHS